MAGDDFVLGLELKRHSLVLQQALLMDLFNRVKLTDTFGQGFVAYDVPEKLPDGLVAAVSDPDNQKKTYSC